MTFFSEVEKPFEKLLSAIQKDRRLLIGPKTAGLEDTRITCENLEDAAGNHFFDDNPGKYGLTQIESHKIRAFFQEGCENYDFVIELHRKFNFLEKENEDYIKRVNNRRNYKELEPLRIFC